jgi:glycosyltransferase involved in cell wall biosynthesis
MPFFSIIIPTYNRATLLPKAIESVIDQTFGDWELIIVDDGSTDNTASVVKPYLADPRITYLYQHNQERCVARNNGICTSTGTYITFLDSDDYFMSQRLALLWKSIVEHGKQEVFYYTGICFDRNGIIGERTELCNNYPNRFDFVINAVIGVPQACIHRDILLKHLFDPRFTIGEDMELWLRVVAHYYLVFLSEQATYVAIDHEARSVNEKRNNPGKAQLALLRYVFKQPHPGTNATRRVRSKKISDTYFSIARHCLYNNKKLNAIHALVRSIVSCVLHEQTKHKFLLLFQVLLAQKTQYEID